MNFTALILFGIFLLALFLRIHELSTIPIGLHVDEINAGYIGRYIFMHGEDISGRILPLYYDKFGDFRSTGIFYLSGLSTFIFGVNSFAIRFPAAFFGALTIFPLYLLTSTFFRSKTVGIAAAFLLAIVPWHIVLSRATSESIVGIFFFISGLYFYYMSVNKNLKKYFFTSLSLFLISYFFYHSFRFVIPLVLGAFIFFPVKKRIKNKLLSVFFIFAVLTAILALSGFGSGRFSQVAFYKNQAPFKSLEYAVKRDDPQKISLKETRFFHNKPVVYTREFIKQYGNYFSLNFLFADGGLPYRYSIPDTGLLYFAFLPFLIGGFIFLVKDQRYKKELGFLCFLLLVGVVPGALTSDDIPNVQRSILMIVPLVVVSAYGLFRLLTWKPKTFAYIVIGVMSLVTFYEMIYFWHNYVVHTKDYKLHTRSEGQRELVFELLRRKKDYKNIIVPIYEEVPALYLYYTKNFDTIAARNLLPRDAKQGSIENITFVNSQCPSSEFDRFAITKEDLLVVDSIECEYNQEGQFKETGFVTYQNGDKAYRLLIP